MWEPTWSINTLWTWILTIPCEPCVFLSPWPIFHGGFCYPVRTSQWFAGCEGWNFNPPSTKLLIPGPVHRSPPKPSGRETVELLWHFFEHVWPETPNTLLVKHSNFLGELSPKLTFGHQVTRRVVTRTSAEEEVTPAALLRVAWLLATVALDAFTAIPMLVLFLVKSLRSMFCCLPPIPAERESLGGSWETLKRSWENSSSCQAESTLEVFYQATLKPCRPTEIGWGPLGYFAQDLWT